jgi:tetratricopeptide (TPR) repeat protein
MVLTSTCLAASGDLKKAEKLAHNKMFLQAIKVLEREASRNQTSARVYFLLGSCYLHTENYDKAEKNFRQAAILAPDYGNKIAAEFKDEGILCLRGNRIESAIHLFDRAIYYQADIAGSIAEDYESFGSLFLQRDDIDTAKQLYDRAIKVKPALSSFVAGTFFSYGAHLLSLKPDKGGYIFNLVISYDPSFARKVCDMYFTALKDDGKASIEFLDKVMKCSNHSDEDIIQALTAKLPGEIKVITIKSGGIHDAGLVEKGQEIQYIYFDHSFEQSIYKAYRRGWGTEANWSEVADQGYYRVMETGRLQIKTNELPLKVILVILQKDDFKSSDQ